MTDHERIAALATATPIGSRWRHVARGTTYTVSGHCMIEEAWRVREPWRPGVRYIADADADGLEIVTGGALFTDGRFEIMSANQ